MSAQTAIERHPQADSDTREHLVQLAIKEGARPEIAELLADEAMGSFARIRRMAGGPMGRVR